MGQTEEPSSGAAGEGLVPDVEELARRTQDLASRAADLARVAEELAERARSEPDALPTGDEVDTEGLEQRVAQALSDVDAALASAHDAERAAGVATEWLSVRLLPDGVPIRVGWRGTE